MDVILRILPSSAIVAVQWFDHHMWSRRSFTSTCCTEFNRRLGEIRSSAVREEGEYAADILYKLLISRRLLSSALSSEHFLLRKGGHASRESDR